MTTNSQESGSLSLADAVNALTEPLPDEGQQEIEAQEAEVDTDAEPIEADSEAQADDEVEVEDSEAEEEAEEQIEEPKFTVKVDGQEVEVTREELLNGYSRSQDYTRKTQALAEQRKAFEAEAQAVQAERQQYAQVLAKLTQQLQAGVEREPDWDALRQQDPIEYSLQWTEWQRKQMRLQAAQAEQARVAQLQAQEQQQRLQQHLAREREALESLLPDIKDEKKAATVKAQIMEQGRKLGFKDEELAQAYDHRAILALHKAALYDAMMERAKATKPAPTKTVEPGRAATQSTVRQKVKQRFAQTGSIQDAARLVQLLG